MKNLKTMLAALPLLATLLSACAVLRPGTPIDTVPFVAQAKEAPCAGSGNRVFVIDQRYVYWDRGASCQDQVQRLYGSTVNELLCYQFSAAHLAPVCSTPAVRELFDTILANRADPRLGLGAGHIVVQLPVDPPETVGLPFTTVAREAFSAIHTPRQVVIRDAQAWAALWAEHTATLVPPPALPAVDFGTNILVAVFAGDSKGCHEFGIRRVVATRDTLAIDYADRDINANAICIAAVTDPMHVVAIPRVDLRPAFRLIVPVPLDFNTVDRSAYTGVREPANVVLKDMDTFTRVWHRLAGPNAAVPAIDFSTSMVVAVFRGMLPNGCYSTEITDVYRTADGINVSRVDTVPGPGTICTQVVVTPAHLVAIPRTDELLTFSVETRRLP
jgi:hypothetical protein